MIIVPKVFPGDCRVGNKNTIVLPDPVSDWIRTLFPFKTIGIACFWMSVGVTMPKMLSFCISFGWRSKSSNDRILEVSITSDSSLFSLSSSSLSSFLSNIFSSSNSSSVKLLYTGVSLAKSSAVGILNSVVPSSSRRSSLSSLVSSLAMGRVVTFGVTNVFL